MSKNERALWPGRNHAWDESIGCARSPDSASVSKVSYAGLGY